MQIKIMIATPKGQASKTEKRIRPFILKAKDQHTTYVNKEDSKIFWEVDAPIKRCLAIQKNVTMFDHIVKAFFENRMFKKHALPRLSPEDREELKNMLLNHTKLKIIKEADAQELVEEGKTYWQRIKETFTAHRTK